MTAADVGALGRAVLRVGVLTPHAAAGPEVELPDMASGRVTVAVARVRTADSGLRALVDPCAAVRAAVPFRDGSVGVVACASTSSGYVLGHRGEAALVEDLHQSCGVPVVSSGSSAVEALRAIGAARVAVVHPPWFDDELDELGSRYFRDEGFEVSLSKASGIPDDPAEVRPGHVIDWVVRHVGPQADAVFIGGNGFRAAGAIDELERRTGRLILEANQVLLWSILGVTRTPWEVSGYGRIFRTPGSFGG